MALEWSEINLWPSKELTKYYMPEGFKETYPTTKVILDSTEFPIEVPSNPTLKQSSFSNYKHRNTMKNVVGVGPDGLIIYCSQSYGGSTSDRAIVERSDLFKKCEPRDSIMADKGFIIEDLFAPHDVFVNIPSFRKGQTQLPGIIISRDRKLANKRVHVERVIGLAKTYKILKVELKRYYVPLASEIFFICCMLCNFRNNIMSDAS